MHRNGLRFLDCWFDSYPELIEGAVFLGEGVAAYTPVILAPLVESDPTPDDELLDVALRSFLIPFYYAWEWRRQAGVLIVGTEDEVLYDASVSLWLDNDIDLWECTVACRNRKMAEVATWGLEDFSFPVLFTGGKHVVGEVCNDDWVVQSLSQLLTSECDGAVPELDRRNLAQHFAEAGIGYAFVTPDEPVASELSVERERQYEDLFRAQIAEYYSDYMYKFLSNRGWADGVTVRPNPKAAARLVRLTGKGNGGEKKKSGKGSEGGSYRSDRLREIWSNWKLFIAWLKGNCSLSRRDAPLTHGEAQALIDNARKHGKVRGIDVNEAGLRGREKTGSWKGIPHFKIGNIHIPVEPGFKPDI